MNQMLWTGEIAPEWEKQFSSYFEIERAGFGLTDSFLSVFEGEAGQMELAEKLQGKDVLLVGYDEVTETVLKQCPDLKLILSVRDGPEENVDIPFCTELGIPVVSAGGRCAHAVAELTLIFMFLLARPVLPLAEYMRTGRWEGEGYATIEKLYESAGELYGKTLGIVGLGRNGCELSKLARGVGMQVLAYDPYAEQSRADSIGVTLCKDFMEMLPKVDYLSLLARVNSENVGMMGKQQFAAMKPTACLINTGRSALVDQQAFYDALQQGVIRAAAVDVFDEEPLKNSDRAFSFPQDKLLLTPHIGGSTIERIPHQYESLYHSFLELLAGRLPGPLKNPQVVQSENFAQRGGKIFGSVKE